MSKSRQSLERKLLVAADEKTQLELHVTELQSASLQPSNILREEMVMSSASTHVATATLTSIKRQMDDLKSRQQVYLSIATRTVPLQV
jgi:hypothetical protein